MGKKLIINNIKKIIIFIPMSYFFLNFASWLLAGIIIYFGILVGIFIPNSIFESLLAFLNELSRNGIIGLLVIAHPFITYFLYLYFKKIYDSIGVHEEKVIEKNGIKGVLK